MCLVANGTMMRSYIIMTAMITSKAHQFPDQEKGKEIIIIINKTQQHCNVVVRSGNRIY